MSRGFYSILRFGTFCIGTLCGAMEKTTKKNISYVSNRIFLIELAFISHSPALNNNILEQQYEKEN